MDHARTLYLPLPEISPLHSVFFKAGSHHLKDLSQFPLGRTISEIFKEPKASSKTYPIPLSPNLGIPVVHSRTTLLSTMQLTKSNLAFLLSVHLVSAAPVSNEAGADLGCQGVTARTHAIQMLQIPSIKRRSFHHPR